MKEKMFLCPDEHVKIRQKLMDRVICRFEKMEAGEWRSQSFLKTRSVQVGFG